MKNIVEFFLLITLVILWWIAEWGIVSMAINKYADKSELRELYVYISILLTILLLLYFKPHLIKHIL